MNTPPILPAPVRKRRKLNTTRSLLMILLIITTVAVAVTNLTGSLCGCEGKVDTARIFTTSEVDAPLLAYKAATGAFPTTKQGLQALITQPAGVSNWRGPYIKKSTLPLDPWGHPYHYAYPSTHGQPVGRYDVWSLGPDGVNGTADDIGNWPY